VTVAPAFVRVRLTYLDPQFDPARIPLPDFTGMQQGGFGVFLIRKLMDETTYRTDPATGTVVLEMLKKLDPL